MYFLLIFKTGFLAFSS